MALKRSTGLILFIFAVVVAAIILSIDTNAKPHYNGNESGCGDEVGCHNYQEWDKGFNISVNLTSGDSSTTNVNIVISNGHQDWSDKLDYRWSDTQDDWDTSSSILAAAEITEDKNNGAVFNTTEGDAPQLRIKAPDGGTWRVYVAYENRTSEESSGDGERWFTYQSIEVPYENRNPEAVASFGQVETGTFIEYKDAEDKYALVEFDKNGYSRIAFDAKDSTDPDTAQGDDKNLTFYWDFYEEDSDENNSFSASSEMPKTDVNFTFKRLRDDGDFEVGIKYAIKLSVTDLHSENAWDVDWLFVKFQAPEEFPDLEIYDAQFKMQDDDENEVFNIEDTLNIEIKIRNNGLNTTAGTDFKLKVKANDKFLFDITYTDELEAGKIDTIIYPWVTQKWPGAPDPISGVSFTVNITIDSDDSITEGPLPWAENNNSYSKEDAFEFADFEATEPNLIIETLTYEPKEVIQDTDLYINITVKNDGNGTAEVFTVEVWWLKAAGITQKVKDKSFQRRDFEVGASEVIEHIILPQLTTTDDAIDEHTYKVVILYKTDEVDSKTFTISVKPEEDINGNRTITEPEENPLDSLLIPIIAIGAIVGAVVVVVVIRSRAYSYEDEDEDEDEDDDDDDDEDYKSKAKK